MKRSPSQRLFSDEDLGQYGCSPYLFSRFFPAYSYTDLPFKLIRQSRLKLFH